MRRRPLLAPFGRTLRWAAAAWRSSRLRAARTGHGGRQVLLDPDLRHQAKVAANGDLTVDMRQSFDFSGSFTYVFWVIDKKKGAPAHRRARGRRPRRAATLTRDVAGRPPGTYSVSDQGSAVTVDTFFNLTDASAAFTLHYRAVGAAVRYTGTRPSCTEVHRSGRVDRADGQRARPGDAARACCRGRRARLGPWSAPGRGRDPA